METVREHLIKRNVDLDLHEHLFIDEEERVATFLLTNGAGHITGYQQQYRPDATKEKRNNPKEGRYFTYRTKSTIAFFGFESMFFRDDVLFITEGIFDAVRLTKLGQPAIAVLSNDPDTDMRNYLSCLNRKVIAVCDSGKAGEKLASCGDISIIVSNGDLGDASEDYVEQVIEESLQQPKIPLLKE